MKRRHTTCCKLSQRDLSIEHGGIRATIKTWGNIESNKTYIIHPERLFQKLYMVVMATICSYYNSCLISLITIVWHIPSTSHQLSQWVKLTLLICTGNNGSHKKTFKYQMLETKTKLS